VNDRLSTQLLGCAVRVVRLLLAGRLHIDRPPLAEAARFPDGRRFVTFRQTSCDPDPTGDDDASPEVLLEVWFHLRGVPAGARVRRWLFERESILNTVLYAGIAGYRTKLWMVDPVTSDYAGMYAWAGAAEAERYGRYITRVLRPLSTAGSVGFEVHPETTLTDELVRQRAGVSNDRA
jgi:hypothetical protein